MKTLAKLSPYLISITVFLIPFYFLRFKILGIPTNIFEVAVIVSAATALTRRKYRSIGWWPWLLPALALVVALWAPARLDALGIFKGWFLVPVIFAWSIIQVWDSKMATRIRVALGSAAALISAWAIMQKLGWITTAFYQRGDTSFDAYLSEGRAFGPFESPNYLAMFLVPVFFIALPLARKKIKLWFKVPVATGLALMLIALFLSGSRGGGAALIIGLFTFLAISFFKIKNIKRWLAAAAIILVIVFNIGYYLVAPHIQNRTGGDAIRVEVLDYSLKLVGQHPVWGVGLGNFQEAIGQISTGHTSFQTYALPFALHPHNLLLAFYLNLGLIGLGLFVYTLYRIFKSLLSPAGASPVGVAALAAILVHGLFDTTYFKNDLAAIFWLIFVFSILTTKKRPRITSK